MHRPRHSPRACLEYHHTHPRPLIIMVISGSHLEENSPNEWSQICTRGHELPLCIYTERDTRVRPEKNHSLAASLFVLLSGSCREYEADNLWGATGPTQYLHHPPRTMECLPFPSLSSSLGVILKCQATITGRREVVVLIKLSKPRGTLR